MVSRKFPEPLKPLIHSSIPSSHNTYLKHYIQHSLPHNESDNPILWFDEWLIQNIPFSRTSFLMVPAGPSCTSPKTVYWPFSEGSAGYRTDQGATPCLPGSEGEWPDSAFCPLVAPPGEQPEINAPLDGFWCPHKCKKGPCHPGADRGLRRLYLTRNNEALRGLTWRSKLQVRMFTVLNAECVIF